MVIIVLGIIVKSSQFFIIPLNRNEYNEKISKCQAKRKILSKFEGFKSKRAAEETALLLRVLIG